MELGDFTFPMDARDKAWIRLYQHVHLDHGDHDIAAVSESALRTAHAHQHRKGIYGPMGPHSIEWTQGQLADSV